ncbi:MAG: hypothetical protein MJ252_15920 [archaeon]|nr:hypothetical protein [archaeon]
MIARSDISRLTWDNSEFPILCDTCLGTSKYVRMIKADYDSECKICKRPFTVFSWKPDKSSRYKRTEICQTCAKLKNVCQTCLFDLQFRLPVEVRDKYLKQKVEIPTETANRDYFTQNVIQNIDKLDLPYYKEGAYPVINEILEKHKEMKKSKEDTKITEDNKTKEENKTNNKNKPFICSFFLKGLCSRGELCPYRHEIPDINEGETEEDKHKNYKERYLGIEDPIAKKILAEYDDSKITETPKDISITTLYICDLTDNSVTEKDISKIFSKYGKIKKISLLLDSFSAFITYLKREDAEKCMKYLHNKLTINMEKYRLRWAKFNNIVEDEKEEKTELNEAPIYKTECPLYDKDKNINNVIKIEESEDTNEKRTIINLTGYDNGEIPYYASIDKNLSGASYLKKKKRRQGDDEYY